MADYGRMYYLLFNAVTDALGLLDEKDPAARLLMQAQQDCEELFIHGDKSEPTML